MGRVVDPLRSKFGGQINAADVLREAAAREENHSRMRVGYEW